ncbi:hypothetical protein Nepgr_011829 [Nepenthes gracilis]|uniref:Peroxiredoxin n=1 Tax=Nepenthes gracilis TaxID=150966 RepID=A0AAD3XM95_NEPGR|nr:hypothetical protein Nepgr_011829 [Nepenthes gracilis]
MIKGKLSLVGNQAPDFEAEAVFDQEFIKFSHLAWVQTDRKSGGLGDLKYPLISDITKTISKAYDVLIADQVLYDLLLLPEMGVCFIVLSSPFWIGTVGVLSRICQGIALRGLFIIDKEGIIRHSTINNLAIGHSVDETPRTLWALQYVQENPDEVWPAGWKPGDRSSHEAESEA